MPLGTGHEPRKGWRGLVTGPDPGLRGAALGVPPSCAALLTLPAEGFSDATVMLRASKFLGPSPGSCAGGHAEACPRPALKDRAVCRQEKTCRQTANPRSGAAERGGLLSAPGRIAGKERPLGIFSALARGS